MILNIDGYIRYKHDDSDFGSNHYSNLGKAFEWMMIALTNVF